MRVIGGTKKRYGLKTPKGNNTRPTSDRIKETLFNIIRDEIYDCYFVDMCAGSGQIGIEALSQGAKAAVFFEQDKTAVSIIKENLKHTDFTDSSMIVASSLPNGIKRLKQNDLHWVFFIDPPYSSNLASEILNELSTLDIRDEDVLFIVESDKDKDFSFATEIGYVIEREKIYKNNKHVFLRRK